jgi:multidrug resistance efflux pump
MKKRRRIILIAAVVILAVAAYCALFLRGRGVVATGIVTTDEVIVSSEVQGRIQELRVREGDTVKRGDLIALIQPKEWAADMSYYTNSERQAGAQVVQAEADLRYQETETTNQVLQAEATLASAKAQVTQAEADQENTRLNATREADLFQKGVDSAQANDQARTANAAQEAKVESLKKQVAAAEAGLELAKANADQVAMRRAMLAASEHQLAAAGAQTEKAEVRLGYTEIHAPIDGIVDTRAALQGEVVNPGQGIVTLINPDDLWVRADVEEGRIDQIRLGDKLPVRLPSGAELEGAVFYRGVDADYATQRDVSRTKRDIKTFEIRLRCDNSNRALAVGMTAYVTLPAGRR